MSTSTMNVTTILGITDGVRTVSVYLNDVKIEQILQLLVDTFPENIIKE